MIGRTRNTFIHGWGETEISGLRTDLVSLPRGADSTLFSGWGVRI